MSWVLFGDFTFSFCVSVIGEPLFKVALEIMLKTLSDAVLFLSVTSGGFTGAAVEVLELTLDITPETFAELALAILVLLFLDPVHCCSSKLQEEGPRSEAGSLWKVSMAIDPNGFCCV